ncbi:MAG: glycosyltransferase [Acidobacteria bacterium]|nr:glycosyltransferase [Acidobacteriota bacterium]
MSARATRPHTSGRFLEVEGRRFIIKGVTYGTFAPDADGVQFPQLKQIDADFAAMAAAGVNTVRVYTVPDRALLDAALRHDLKVMIGVPWTQHVAFLGDRSLVRDIRRQTAAAVGELASHPAALMFALGNEIPAPVVRWHGHEKIERFLRELVDASRQADPAALLTYVNFPPTEYLDLDCFDVCSFNVYLHRQTDLRAYLARLQHVAGYRPFLLAEAGADSIREGLDGQARITSMHVRTAFEEGAAGAIAFAWTDEWWRGGHTVEDWHFGLVDREREPKPALAAVSAAFADSPFPAEVRATWPKVSVVVCAYNAADTLDDCLSSLSALTYPNAEIIVVNDGSRDATGTIARRYPLARVIDIPNGGLSAARNVGLAHATGEIVAYTDADVRVDPDWLTYLVQPIISGKYVGSGGPNVVPPDDDWVAQAVARSPGGPTHVLLNDRTAEHVPGCNMAFRRDALASIGGFNPVYLRAGDDVDICWRLQARGHEIGFAPSALVWHHHRSTVGAYWRQQVGYGEGETWLDAHHPEKFVRGQMLWRGHIYSPLPFLQTLRGRRVNTGVWGTAAFPSIYNADSYRLEYLPHSPAWMGLSTVFMLAGLIDSATSTPDFRLLLIGLAGWMVTIIRCMEFARQSDLRNLGPIGTHGPRRSRLMYQALIAWLHIIHPLARVRGRLKGLSSMPRTVAEEHIMRRPWKVPFPDLSDAGRTLRMFLGFEDRRVYWSEAWVAHSTLLTETVGVIRAARPAPPVEVDEGWQPDRDFSLAVGRWGWLHTRTLIEEHARGRCLFRSSTRLRLSGTGIMQAMLSTLTFIAATIGVMSMHRASGAVLALTVLGLVLLRAAWQAARTSAALDRALWQVITDAGLVPISGTAGSAVDAAEAAARGHAAARGA